MKTWDPRIELAEYLDEEGNFTEQGKLELEAYSQKYYRDFEEKKKENFAIRDRMIASINNLLSSKTEGYAKEIEKIVAGSEYARFAAQFNCIRDFQTSSAINSIETSAGVVPTIYGIVESIEEYVELKMLALHCFRRIQMMRPNEEVYTLFNELIDRKVSLYFIVQTLREAKLGDKGYVCHKLGEIYKTLGLVGEAEVMISLSRKEYSSIEPSYSFDGEAERKKTAGLKICFVSCVNDQRMYDECLYYISNLLVPDGVEVDSFCVTEAKSMTSGYNEAMRSFRADVYVFLHQDVNIINPYFIEDLMEILETDEKIGVVGMVGSPKLPPDAVMWHGARVGALYRTDSVVKYGKKTEERFSGVIDVEAVDGLLIATNKGILFREDIFDGWDFYDASICEEYRKQGYRVVVPDQCVPWVIHDDGLMNLYSYGKYRQLFLEEYYGKKYSF